MALKVFRATGTPHVWLTVANTSLQTLPAASGLHTYEVRVPVLVGDIVGLRGQGTGGCAQQTSNAADTWEYFTGTDIPPGSAGTYIASTGWLWNIQAKLEPDADGDGYGDETQDACPTNAGTQGSCSPPPPPPPDTTIDKTKPTLGSFSLSVSVFKAAKSGPAFSSKQSRAPTGSRVSYKLSEASSVKFTVQRKTRGRRVHGKCKAPTHSNRKKPKCTRWKRVKGSFTVAGKAGKNTFKFRGRIGGKALKPGRYRLSGQATDPSKNKSVPKNKGFRIVK
jgi:hypothetical protein